MQNLNIVELEARFEMSAAAESASIEVGTVVLL
jgi:hypothetical protein